MISIGLDIATRTGVAFQYNNDPKIQVMEVHGDPVKLLETIYEIIPKDHVAKVYYEKLVHFRNARTVRDLLERSGFVRWSLKNDGYLVDEVHVQSVRSWLGVKNKAEAKELIKGVSNCKVKITDNHSDAVGVLLFANKLKLSDVNQIDIIKGVDDVVYP